MFLYMSITMACDTAYVWTLAYIARSVYHESVKAYLVGEGINASRLVASGKGESSPVAGNETASRRKQNRRVEVIIADVNNVSR